MAWNSRISLVQVDEKFTKFQFLKQLCPSWDLPLLFSVHEPKDFSCSCSGLERNPIWKNKKHGHCILNIGFRIPFGGLLSAETLRLWRWMAAEFFIHGWVWNNPWSLELSSQGPRNMGNPFATHKSVQESLDKRFSGIILQVNLSSTSDMGWMYHIIMTIICSSEGFQTIWRW